MTLYSWFKKLYNKGYKTMSKKKILIPVIIFTAIIVVLMLVLYPSSSYKKLSISESKWNSIKESRTENNNLVLEDIKFNDYKLIIDEKNNTLYYSAVNDSPNKYNPIVQYSTGSKNVKLAIFSDEITSDKVKNNYKFKIMIYNEEEYHIYILKCTELPIINISYNKNEKIDDNNIQMEMYLFDNLSSIPNKITISSGKIKMNQDEYFFSLHMLTPGKNKRSNRRSILNMKPNSEYILSPINSESENKNHRIELFLNNEYKGVYSIMEGTERGHIKEKVE